MKDVLEKVKKNNNRDYELVMIYQNAKAYDIMGHKDSLEKYYTRYLNLKDILRKESGYGEIETLDFLTEIEQANKDLESLSIRHQQAKKKIYSDGQRTHNTCYPIARPSLHLSQSKADPPQSLHAQ